jgi:hypothetical protein
MQMHRGHPALCNNNNNIECFESKVREIAKWFSMQPIYALIAS